MSNNDNNDPVRRVTTRGGGAMPALGLGTWRMGEDGSKFDAEVAALRLGLDLGMDLIDSAEMYADGGAEAVTGAAVKGRRDAVFIVSKVHPKNASRRGTIEACERSLGKLGTDRIDLYLLHWEGQHPLRDTLDAFAQLVDEQKIVHFGVSNFDVAAMATCDGLGGGPGVIANQVIYNLSRRGIEWNLLPWCAERDIAVMAYSPLEAGRGLQGAGLSEVARRHGVSEACVALAWTLRHAGVVSIPKASNPEHVRQNRQAHDLALTDEDLALIDGDYPPPTGPVALAIL